MCDITAYPVSHTVTAPLAVTVIGHRSHIAGRTGNRILTIQAGERRQLSELQTYVSMSGVGLCAWGKPGLHGQCQGWVGLDNRPNK